MQRRLRRQFRNKDDESSPTDLKFQKHSTSKRTRKPESRKALRTGNLEFPVRMGISCIKYTLVKKDHQALGQFISG
jgi:hypothetical protein